MIRLWVPMLRKYMPVSTLSHVLTNTSQIGKLQSEDESLRLIRSYLKDGTLPSDEKQARKILLDRDRFVLMEDILYSVDPGPQHRLRIVVPDALKQKLMDENHSGQFGGHFAGRSLHRTLAQHYW